jgi:hypothetical protein
MPSGGHERTPGVLAGLPAAVPAGELDSDIFGGSGAEPMSELRHGDLGTGDIGSQSLSRISCVPVHLMFTRRDREGP